MIKNNQRIRLPTVTQGNHPLPADTIYLEASPSTTKAVIQGERFFRWLCNDFPKSAGTLIFGSLFLVGAFVLMLAAVIPFIWFLASIPIWAAVVIVLLLIK